MALQLGIPSIQFPSLRLGSKKEDKLSEFERLNKKLKTYMSRKGRDVVAHAFKTAREAHSGQNRHSGEPYITHPLAVARIVADMNLDFEAVSGALLHDVVEDTEIELQHIQEQFGPNIARIVDGLTKLDKIKSKKISGPISPAQSENFQKLVLATAKDLRVILIKFSDRLHNLKTADALDPARRKKMAKETMLIYAPLANRLGMERLRMELEDLSFAAAYPMRYGLFKSAVEKARAGQKDYITGTIATIKKIMKKNKVNCGIVGRRKNIAGIYAKMSMGSSEWLDLDSTYEKKSLQEIMDVYGIRIIVKKVETCYKVLGIMHTSFKPVSGRFKDYISTPKKNSYQSLHTTLIGPKGYPLEIQIRTEAMENVAESGIAAHYIYKNSPQDPARLFSWLQGLELVQAESKNANDFVNKTRQELSLKEIFVYTPNGDLISLPEGATPVDFAYAVHTDLGAKCIACEVDRVPAPLNTRLKNGQVISIIADKDSSPDLSWIASVVTPKALSHISNSANVQRNTDIYGVGEKMLRDTMVSHFGCEITAISDKSWDAYLAKHKLKTRNELYEKISTGEITPLVAGAHLLPTQQDQLKGIGPKSRQGASMGINKRLVTIKYARCCNPIPGDSIVVISTRQDGIHVHRTKCTNLRKGEAKKRNYNIIQAHWEEEMAEQGDFLVSIRCEITTIADVISRIVNILANNHIGVHEVVTQHSTANLKVLMISMLVKDCAHLAGIMRKLRFIRGVNKISRL